MSKFKLNILRLCHSISNRLNGRIIEAKAFHQGTITSHLFYLFTDFLSISHRANFFQRYKNINEQMTLNEFVSKNDIQVQYYII